MKARIVGNGVRVPTWRVMGGERRLEIPEEKFRQLFPIAYKRHLPVYIVGEDASSYIVATPLGNTWRITRVSKAYLELTPKSLVSIIPPAR